MSRRVVYFILNGIHTNPAQTDGWVDEAATLLNRQTPDYVKPEKFEYYTTALTRRLFQARRAEKLLHKALGYAEDGWTVRMIGHSNGCDLIARVALAADFRLDSVHLIAPAAEDKHFADAVIQSKIRRVHIYGSENDKALQAAGLSAKLLNFVGLGFGSLGLRGKALADCFPGRVFDHSRHHYGHSTWLGGLALPGTVREILQHDDLLPA
jgi:pimeloyl-ACP methyl ester carboxylesterase